MDSILVYGQAKSAFGWPEGASESPVPMKPPSVPSGQVVEEGEGEEEETGERMPDVSNRPLSHLGR